MAHAAFRRKKTMPEQQSPLTYEGVLEMIRQVTEQMKETADVKEHIERMEKYRLYADIRGIGDKKRFIGAVAGAVVNNNAARFAQESGMYVIVQSGEATEIITQPDGFTPKEW